MVELQHVKGHQDSKCFGPFTRDATLNIKADQLARGKLDTYTPVTSNFHIPWSQGACYTGNRCIEKSFATEIRDYINGQTTTTYWLKLRELTKGIWKKIDWESIGRAMQEIPVNQHRWVAKYVSGHFATGKNMCRWQFQSSSQCLRCGDPQEDKHHILNCHAPEARELWEKSLKAIECWLKEEGIDIGL